MTKAKYVIYLLLTMFWSMNLDKTPKRNAIAENSTPQMEDLPQGSCEYIKNDCELNQGVKSTSVPISTTPSSSPSPSPSPSPTPPECSHEVNNYGACPDGLQSHITDNDTYCYELKHDQKFPISCKYPYKLPYSKIPKSLLKILSKYDIFLNIFRDNSSLYPNFMNHENGNEYGNPLHKIDENEGDLDSDCIVKYNNRIKRVPCSGGMSTVCVYSYNRLQTKRLLSKCDPSGHHHCVISDFDTSQPKCFCKTFNASRPTKQKFCSKLAEPIHVYQTVFLKTFLQNNNMGDTCWMGMHKNINVGTYEWSTTQQTVNYTDWSQPYDCKNSEGAFKFSSFPCGGWILSQDKTLKCALCEISLHVMKPRLTLKFNKSKNRVELTVEYFHWVSDGEGREDIYCFSDSNEDEFTHRVSYAHLNYFGDTKTAYLVNISTSPSRYWCHAFQFSSHEVIKSNIIVAYNNEYSYSSEFEITAKYYLNTSSSEDPFVRKKHFEICFKIKNYLLESIEQCDNGIASLRPVSAEFGSQNKYIIVNCHLITNCTSRTTLEQYDEINNILSKAGENFGIIIESFKNNDFCSRNTTLSPDNQILIWPSTFAGATVIPVNVLCLDKSRDMLPVTRKCIGNHETGAEWDEPVGQCYNDTKYSETTNTLFNLVHGNASTQEITQSLLKITEKSISDEFIDVHLATSALERITVTEEEKIHQDNFSVIINNMMNFNSECLETAQSSLNSTDRLLSLLDNFLINQIDRQWIKILPRLVIQISDLRKSNIRGLAMHKVSNSENFQSYIHSQLYHDTSFEKITKDPKLDIAVLFPSEEVNKIKEKFADDTSIMLVIVVFYDDILFRETGNKSVQQSRSKVVGVTVPGYQKLNNPIKIALQTVEKYENKKNCSFWDYGLNDEKVSIHGQWETSAESETELLLEICEFQHMTHFGLLIQGDLVRTPNDLALNIITALGSALSLIGIIPIFLTAIMFKSWRNKAGNVILINFCIAIIIQITLMFSLYAITGDGIACKAIAACLHYIVVSEFCWMFVVAMLQYRRFVTVFTPQESNIIVKCLVAGWIVPLLPVVVTLSTSIESYSINAHNFCYISGNYMIYAYICPILLILVCNAVVFIKVMYSVSRQTAACMKNHRNYKLQILLGLFLFFVLGMTWVFGFLATLADAMWLTYIFCVTATLRGIVLFLFFIVGNEETSLMWKKKTTRYYVDKNSRKPSKPCTSDTIISTD